MKSVTTSEFADFVISSIPKFDKEIISSIRPEDGWIAHVTGGTWDAWANPKPYSPPWFRVREKVRALAEGEMFKPSIKVKTAVDHTRDRFEAVFPDISKDWTE